MKYLISIIAAGITVAGFFNSANASTKAYPIYPPGNQVILDPGDFIKYVPEYNRPCYLSPDECNVIGNKYANHPGGFGLWGPALDAYFIGVFAGVIDAAIPGNALYLWETTGSGLMGDAGPLLGLGFWDGMRFIPNGDEVAASYYGTGESWYSPYPGRNWQEYEISASIIPLSAFNMGGAQLFNAVKVSYNPAGHNQVTAIATNVVPEPATMFLFSSGMFGLLGSGWYRKKLCSVTKLLTRKGGGKK